MNTLTGCGKAHGMPEFGICQFLTKKNRVELLDCRYGNYRTLPSTTSKTNKRENDKQRK